ncbi:glycerol-3-phosphate dehydrogenase/oxidase [Alicyclobacillus sp. SO9]|uniref:glycerol-3-phosphate dehydrogenase/oxidase n=1 Tax=Alicyclobacillus sp. SO9 TaxID=2665646 RepID=UPI0018E7DB95|nr:FAD-dependent oxidoreductase [Alicyclobacillus sp. SO9]QQE77595.1 FAD-dependent oxidoreductase [Alicyclobacillus sp. SO9]
MGQKFTYLERNNVISEMQSADLDVLVVGGGVTGAGILLDAQSRGMKSGLVEMQDFAAGTSSRSTKLVHGGLRYLKQFEVELVAEVGQERAIVYENAPHVTTPLWMILPIVKKGTFGMFMSSIGLYMYDRLAKVRETERRTMLSKQEARAIEPLLRAEDLKGAGKYVEYRTDDARLTLEIMKEAVHRGALALNYTRVTQLVYEHGKVIGVEVSDVVTGTSYVIKASKVINAAGPWVDDLRTMDKSKQGKSLHLTKGVHVVVDQSRFPLQNPVYFDVPDGRMVFAIPREGKVYVGTTDTNYQGDPKLLRVTKQDRDYLVDCVNSMFPSVQLTSEDIESFWAGVRPLIHEDGKAPSEISRKDEVFVSNSGLITIAGGKLTGYRKMADKVVSLVSDELRNETGREFADCFTDKIELSGGKFGGSHNMRGFLEKQIEEGVSLGLSREEAERLVNRYGTNVITVYDILKANQLEAQASGLSLEVYGALVYGLDNEMVMTPSDFFIRRTGAMFFHIDWVQKWKVPVINYMAKVLNWSENETQKHAADLNYDISVATEVVSDDE